MRTFMYMDDRQFWITLGNDIRTLRQERGMTLLELSARTDMDKSNLSKIEQGQAKPATTTLLKIAKALDTVLRLSFEKIS